MSRRTGRLAAVSLLIGVSAVSLNGCDKGAAKDAAETATAAIPVQVDRPTRGEMLSVYAGTAPLQADQEATVVAKVGGEVREILVEEGDIVKAGQILARLDGDRLRFELQQTEVNLRKLEREYQRTLELFNRKLVASAAVDNARSEMEWLKAARDLAQLNVGYTEIRAPIAGVVSARHIKVGNTINVNDRTFQVTDLDPLIAEVHVPEREFAKLRAEQAATVIVDALAGTNSMQRPAPSRPRSKSSIPDTSSSPACSPASASCSSDAAPRCVSRAARSSKPKARRPCSSRTATRPNSAASRPA